jgi:hypothetical protein
LFKRRHGSTDSSTTAGVVATASPLIDVTVHRTATIDVRQYLDSGLE